MLRSLIIVFPLVFLLSVTNPVLGSEDSVLFSKTYGAWTASVMKDAMTDDVSCSAIARSSRFEEGINTEYVSIRPSDDRSSWKGEFYLEGIEEEVSGNTFSALMPYSDAAEKLDKIDFRESELQLRIDKNNARTLRREMSDLVIDHLFNSKGYVPFGGSDGQGLIDEMTLGNSMLVRYTNIHGNTIDTIFSLSGVGAAKKSLLERCPIRK